MRKAGKQSCSGQAHFWKNTKSEERTTNVDFIMNT